MSLGWVKSELDRLDREGLRRTRRRVTPLGQGWCEIDGRRLRNFASNDYLGLAGHPRVLAAAAAAIAAAGAGARASALVTGRSPWHEHLEQQLAEFYGTAGALLFPTGYAANVGTITALVDREDAVFCDRLNHASLIDGCRLSGAKFQVYPHCDVDALEHALQRSTARRRLIVTDSLFSMDGDAAPLRELNDIALRHEAMLLVDEAHATGVFGPGGRGLLAECDVTGSHLVKVGTLSKGLGSQGGFVAGEQALVDWLFNQARPQMFSTALTPAACAAAAAALEVLAEEPHRPARLLEAAQRFRDRLGQYGVEVLPGAIGPIVPVILGETGRTLAAARALEERGHLVACIRPPTVPRDTSRLRITLTADHTADDLEALAEGLREVTREKFVARISKSE